LATCCKYNTFKAHFLFQSDFPALAFQIDQITSCPIIYFNNISIVVCILLFVEDYSFRQLLAENFCPSQTPAQNL